ncbi:long-chain fatty acid--CoA ligase [Paraburkholderia caledonica]|uniref:Fatty-acyl-CoA synthase n=1 Tax=Paraburkholderia caledonica TaxID=134536 RepID=A0ABU1KYY3_9BURK|nr:long-chain fatty acid--CoA ligase [Paraburkholderia caledonica]MDR6376134.1 fatty-acyl-CoA synthase [Paraburkholderia caledonica]
MQHRNLNVASLIRHARVVHGDTEVVGAQATGTFVRTNWQGIDEKARGLAACLLKSGVRSGDRVASIAWNSMEHLELYFATTAAGTVLHTINPRLHAEQIEYLLDHGGSRILFIDQSLLPLVTASLDQRKELQRVVVFGAGSGEPLPHPCVRYEDFLSLSDEALEEWPDVDESAASLLCYTSGTTGNPKGVLYSQRSVVLHAYGACSADGLAISARDSILLLAPMFHVNAWGAPFYAAMAGSKLVLPGRALDPASVLSLLEKEGCTYSLAVPTVWFSILDYAVSKQSEVEARNLQLERVMIGGASVSKNLIARMKDILGVRVLHSWGMTETSPVATVSRPSRKHLGYSEAELITLRTSPGRPLFGIELQIEAESGKPAPRDGVSAGKLKVRGNWVAAAYFGRDEPATDTDGWFDTGDIARISSDGFLHLTDRAKDVIKSGGEWISSVDLENTAAGHPSVAEAAVVGVFHEKWQERPILLLRLRPDMKVTRDEMLNYLTDKVARWWLPDDVIVVESLPHSATGKILKRELREHYKDHLIS